MSSDGPACCSPHTAFLDLQGRSREVPLWTTFHRAGRSPVSRAVLLPYYLRRYTARSGARGVTRLRWACLVSASP